LGRGNIYLFLLIRIAGGCDDAIGPLSAEPRLCKRLLANLNDRRSAHRH
jgi:hypothetical protein